jgi:serine/threonine-protein kinase RsbW
MVVTTSQPAFLQTVHPAIPASVRTARREVASFAARHGADAQTISSVTLAVSEACTNAVLHAAERSSPPRITITAESEPGHINVSVRDFGATVRPRLEDLGAHESFAIIQALADEVELRPGVNDGIELRMEFGLTH